MVFNVTKAVFNIKGTFSERVYLFASKTPRGFGTFFGYLALMTAIASVMNGYISDRIKNRKFFFYFVDSLADFIDIILV